MTDRIKIYVDDIIFGATQDSLCEEFVAAMKGEFEMSMIVFLSWIAGQAKKVWNLFRPVDQDVFVRDLNRQLGTPSHWLPVNSCKKEDKEAP